MEVDIGIRSLKLPAHTTTTHIIQTNTFWLKYKGKLQSYRRVKKRVQEDVSDGLKWQQPFTNSILYSFLSENSAINILERCHTEVCLKCFCIFLRNFSSIFFFFILFFVHKWLVCSSCLGDAIIPFLYMLRYYWGKI